jgi:hypothetical protein
MDLKQPSGGSLSEALNRVTVRDLLASKERLTRKKKVVVLEHNQTVSQALKVRLQCIRAMGCCRYYPMRHISNL